MGAFGAVVASRIFCAIFLTQFTPTSHPPLNHLSLAVRYDATFADQRYHSHYDTPDRGGVMDIDAVTSAATITARALYSLAGGDSTSDIPVVRLLARVITLGLGVRSE